MTDSENRANLQFLVDYINTAVSRVRGTNTLTATVTGVNPLRIRLDGDDEPLPYTPASTTCTGGVGSRVLVSFIPRTDGSNGRFIVTGSIDGGWKTLPLIITAGAGFNAYDNDPTVSLPRYMLRNGFVTVTGAISPNSNRTISTTQQFSTLPVGYRPSKRTISLCQGSTNSIWAIRVNPDGGVYAERYRDASGSYITVATDAWLPFHVVFPVN